MIGDLKMEINPNSQSIIPNPQEIVNSFNLKFYYNYKN